jgi:Peptidase family M23
MILAVPYDWPVRPFGRQHPVRAFFCDPRIGEHGGKSFHFGIDVSAPDRTPVFAIDGGRVDLEAAQNVAVVSTGGARTFGYWHLEPAVRHGQHVERHALLGHIARGWAHVHLAERSGGEYRNPLRAGALAPFFDFGPPSVDRIVASLDRRALHGPVDLVAEAHDVPPIAAAPPWRGLPVTPALVRWRLVGRGREVVPWRIVADFRTTLPPPERFDDVYAPGTRQNHPNASGLYRFWLARGWDTTRHPDGSYRLDVEAADIRGNASRGHATLVIANNV